MKNIDWLLVKTCLNEEAAALTVASMNSIHPNVVFDGLETGCGTYDICVKSRYGQAISMHTLNQFSNEALIIYSSIPVIKKELGL